MKRIFSVWASYYGVGNVFKPKSQVRCWRTWAIGLRQQVQVTGRAPAGPFFQTCLCAALLPFPVVEAWSVWNKTGEEDGFIMGYANNLRLKHISKAADKKALAEILYNVDNLYKFGDPVDFPKIHEILLEQKDKMEPEIHWRLARIKYELAKKAGDGTEKGKMLEEAFQLATAALEMDEGNFAVHKWMAILLNEVSILRGLKEQISQSVAVKKYIMRAVELNPGDPTSHYMLGSWCFSVAEVPWYQKKVAATLFATPPESTFQEALQHFLDAEKLDPGFFSMNHLMLAKSYLLLGETSKAAKYLKMLEARKVRTDDDFKAKVEAAELIKKHFKSKQHLDEIIQLEEVATA